MNDIKDYWSYIHKENVGRYLSGTSGTDVWKVLGITDLIKPGKNILNIGIGFGACTREMAEHNPNIYGLDICQEALDRVKDFLSGSWLDENIEDLLDNFFDVAISHLVAQHMSDESLERQFKHVIRSLKKEGVFAIQFLSYITNQDPRKDKRQEGTNTRTLEQITRMAERNNGRVILSPPPIKYNNVILDDVLISAEWLFAQIQRVS